MDSLTQIVVGIATVEAIAGKDLKNKSFLYGAVLGTIPDLDVLVGKLFPYELELAFHRSFTHSILGVLILSPCIAWLIRKWNKTLSFSKWTLVIAATFATHILIDLFTAWGVQLFYPHPARFSFKTIFVINPLYTLPWIVALLIILRSKTNREKWLCWGFIISSCYLVWGASVKIYVNHKVEEALSYQKIDYIDYMVKPTFANSLLWNINVQTDTSFLISDYSILDKKPIQWKSFKREPLLEQSLQVYPSVQTLAEVCEGWYTLDYQPNGHIIFNDLRFGQIEKPDATFQFVFSYELIPTADGYSVSPLPKTLQDGKKSIQKIGQRIKGN